MRLSEVGTPDVLEKFDATFESYWSSPEYEDYKGTAEQTSRFDRAVSATREDTLDAPLTFLEVEPWPHQREILEKLDAERKRHNRWKNLVVAATGTGKTIVAALDYKRLRNEKQLGPDPRLLFVAHRQEILKQSLGAFRQVLRSGDFGELYVDGDVPDDVAARVRLRPVPVADGLRPAQAGRVRRGDRRRVPPGRRAHLQEAARAPEAEGAARAHRHARTHRQRGHPPLLRWPHRRGDAAVGRAGAEPGLPVPVLRRPRQLGPVVHQVDACGLRRQSAREALHGQRRARGDGPPAAAGQASRRPHHARARLLRQHRARGVHGAEVHGRRPAVAGGLRQYGQRRPQAGAAGPARRAHPGAVRGGPVQRRRGPARGGHAAVPPAHGKRARLPAAAWPRPAPLRGQGLRHRAGLHRPGAPAVPLRPALPRGDRRHAHGGGEADRAGLPVPAGRLLDATGPGGHGHRPQEHPVGHPVAPTGDGARAAGTAGVRPVPRTRAVAAGVPGRDRAGGGRRLQVRLLVRPEAGGGRGDARGRPARGEAGRRHRAAAPRGGPAADRGLHEGPRVTCGGRTSTSPRAGSWRACTSA